MANERSTTESASQITGTGKDVRQTSPTLITPIIQDASGATSLGSQLKRCTTQFDAVSGTTGTTLTNLTGLTGFTLAAGGTYVFEIFLNGVATANSGMKIGFKYTTATMTSLEAVSVGAAAAAVVTQHTTTATDQASLIASTTAFLGVRITGMIVVNAAGTLAIQAAQNASHADTTSIYAGSFARFTRVA